jgi:hypothetical protein
MKAAVSPHSREPVRRTEYPTIHPVHPETMHSVSFRVFRVSQTLRDLADQVPGMVEDRVEFVVIDGGEGRFGVWSMERLPAELQKLKVPPEIGLDKVGLIAVLPHLEAEARDLSRYTAGEISDLVDAKGIVIELKGGIPAAIHSRPPMLGVEGLLGGLFPVPPGGPHPVPGREYTLKYCPHCDRPFFMPVEVEGKRVCPHCRQEV